MLLCASNADTCVAPACFHLIANALLLENGTVIRLAVRRIKFHMAMDDKVLGGVAHTVPVVFPVAGSSRPLNEWIHCATFRLQDGFEFRGEQRIAVILNIVDCTKSKLLSLCRSPFARSSTDLE